MKIFILTSLMFSYSLFASEIRLDCKKLLSGNSNGEAYTLAMDINAGVTIDLNNEDAELRGTIVTKQGQYHRQGEVEDIVAFFTDGKKFQKDSSSVKISSFDRNLIMCGMTQSPCRKWEEMTVNLKSLEVFFERSHSYKAFGGDKTYSHSLKFRCTKI